MRPALVVALLIICGGCVTGPNYQRPRIAIPARLPGQTSNGEISLADQAWWSLYSDPKLAALIKEALQNNFDLKTAIARAEQARAYVGIARSAYYPTLGFQTGAQLDHGVYKMQPDLRLATTNATKGLFLGGLSTAWEVDLWGRIRRSVEAYDANYFSTQQARRGLMLSLVSDVATAYFELVELDRRQSVAITSRDAFIATRKLFGERFGAGIVSKLQVTRAESALAASEATLHHIEMQIGQKQNQICILAGRNPGPVDRTTPENQMEAPPTVPAGLPSQLLERRPDVLEAEQNLRAASANIGVVSADFFPRIGLTTVLGRASTSLASLTSGQASIWSLASSFSGPIFTGGQLTNRVRAAREGFNQAKNQYAETTLQAFREVSDALIRSEKLAQVEEEQKREVAALSESVAIANRRYLGGLASYYEVLEAQQLLYPAEIALSETSGYRRLAVVQLYRTLGGGWDYSNTRWTQGRP